MAYESYLSAVSNVVSWGVDLPVSLLYSSLHFCSQKEPLKVSPGVVCTSVILFRTLKEKHEFEISLGYSEFQTIGVIE